MKVLRVSVTPAKVTPTPPALRQNHSTQEISRYNFPPVNLLKIKDTVEPLYNLLKIKGPREPHNKLLKTMGAYKKDVKNEGTSQ